MEEVDTVKFFALIKACLTRLLKLWLFIRLIRLFSLSTSFFFYLFFFFLAGPLLISAFYAEEVALVK